MRQIRTAGKGSGSVELTLPGALRGLVGLPCRILLHDGEQPDIVLQPALSEARAAFAAVFRACALALLGDPAPPFDPAAFRFGLLTQPPAGAAMIQGPPALCWQDGLALAAATAPGSDAVRDSDPGAGAPATGRVVAACAEVLAGELGIVPSLAARFGAVCGFLAAGRMVVPAWQEACDIAAARLAAQPSWQPGAAAGLDPRLSAFWARLGPGLLAASDLFAALSQDEAAYPDLQAAWRRGHAMETTRDTTPAGSPTVNPTANPTANPTMNPTVNRG